MQKEVYDSIANDYINIMGVRVIDEYDAELVQLKELYDGKLKKSPSYFEYYRFFRSLIHRSDEKLFDAIFSSENIFDRVREKGKITAIFKLRNRIGKYEPYQFETFLYDGDEYDCLFTWKITDRDNNLLEDSLKVLSLSYHKILKANLSNDTFVPIKIIGDNRKVTKFSTWCRDFCNYGNIFHEDINDFLEFTKIVNLKEMFKKNTDKKEVFRYRRLSEDGTFRWAKITVLPSKEFTESNNIVMIYVKDIHDDHIHQMII